MMFRYLGNRYGLLLHNLVNGCSVAFVHFVKLINAANTLQQNELFTRVSQKNTFV